MSLGDTIPISGFINGSDRTPFTSRQPRKALISKNRGRGANYFNTSGGSTSTSSAIFNSINTPPHLRHSASLQGSASQQVYPADTNTVGRTAGVHITAVAGESNAAGTASPALHVALPSGLGGAGGNGVASDRRRSSTSRFVGVLDTLTGDMAELR